MDNDDGTKPYAHGSLSQQLGDWQRKIGVRDEAGQPVRVHAHQFRHTVGTRLINAGVPQHVIQKLLGHASPRMTARYAQIHDSTVRDAFERYCHQRVNTAGEALPYDPDASTADAEWVKHNLSRIHDSLPNGYCGRPPQQDCPHPNACLTCPDFQTTPEFLDVHRQHAATNRKLIARADANGQFRLAGNLRRVQDSLDQIIPALESFDDNGDCLVSRADNTVHLRRAAADRRAAATRRTIAAIEEFDRIGASVTVAGRRIGRRGFAQLALRTARPPRRRPSTPRTHLQRHPGARRAASNRRVPTPASRRRTGRDRTPPNRERVPTRPARPGSRRTAPPSLNIASRTCPRRRPARQNATTAQDSR